MILAFIKYISIQMFHESYLNCNQFIKAINCVPSDNQDDDIP